MLTLDLGLKMTHLYRVGMMIHNIEFKTISPRMWKSLSSLKNIYHLNFVFGLKNTEIYFLIYYFIEASVS